jgi:hypothetical protein
MGGEGGGILHRILFGLETKQMSSYELLYIRAFSWSVFRTKSSRWAKSRRLKHEKRNLKAHMFVENFNLYGVPLSSLPNLYSLLLS